MAGPVLIFSWNIDFVEGANDPERFSRCLSVAAKRFDVFDRVIACFQEVPWVDSGQANLLATGLLTNAAGVWDVRQRNHHVAFAFKGFAPPAGELPLDVPHSVGHGRAHALELTDVFTSAPLQLVGVHLPDKRLSLPPSPTRDKVMGSFVERIRLHWKKDAPIIVLGDFNENPFDWIMGSRAGFFATRDRTEATTRPSRGQFDDDKPPLHNPCWKFLPEQPEPPHGTYKFSDDNYSSCRWQWVDQIITSSNIADRIEQLRILHEADAHLLVTADGNPRSKALALPTYSDHLPVEAVFKPE